MRISTVIYLVVVSGALVTAALQVIGVGEVASWVLGYALVLLLAAELFRRQRQRAP